MIYVYALPAELGPDRTYPGYIPTGLIPLTWGDAPEEIGLDGVQPGNDLQASKKALANHLLKQPYATHFKHMLVIDTTGQYTMRINGDD